MFLLDGKVLQLDTPFEHDGTSYPANWLRLASPEARAAIGITEVVEQPRPDDRFYWVSGPDNNGDYTAIPKDLEGLKANWKAQFKQTAYVLLARDMVRSTCAIVIADIEAATDIDAFITAATSVVWPTDPNSIDAR